LKELETKFETYSHLLVDVPVLQKEGSVEAAAAAPEGAEEAKGTEKPVEAAKSHPVVVELESIGFNVRRVDVAGFNGRNADGTAATPETRDEPIHALISRLYDMYCDDNGSLAWLMKLKARDDEAAAAVAAEQAEGVKALPAEDGEALVKEGAAPVADTNVAEAPKERTEEADAEVLVEDDDGAVTPPRNAVSEINEKIKNIQPEAKAKLIAKCNEVSLVYCW
jgi:hypothetical protein